MAKEDSNNKTASDDISSRQSYIPVSSESSLDSFIMGLPGDNELRKNTPLTSLNNSMQAPEKPLVPATPKDQQNKPPSFSRPSHTHFLLPACASQNNVPEFLYQLTKMLYDENKEIIEWNNGRIEVHNPQRLESEVLHKYFRHSKFASLQRQLNYFGFRKIAGKGKMAPCSYVNESARGDLSSLIYIKRKGSVGGPDPNDSTKKNTQIKIAKATTNASKSKGMNPVLVGILHRSSNRVTDESSDGNSSVPDSQQAIAQSAVGRGIRHGWSSSIKPSDIPMASQLRVPDPTYSNEMRDRNLSQLASSYRNSLTDMEQANDILIDADPTPLEDMKRRPAYGFLSQNSSLVDLAMIPGIDEGQPPSTDESNDYGLTFIDFPNTDLRGAQGSSGKKEVKMEETLEF